MQVILLSSNTYNKSFRGLIENMQIEEMYPWVGAV